MTTPDNTITAITTLEWHGCYAANWNTAPLVPEAYSHPAKVAFGLAKRIYRHLLAQGYVKPGSLVVDPFAGVGGFAFHAMYHGLHFRGCELEARFVDMASGYDCPGFSKTTWKRFGHRIERLSPRLCPECKRVYAATAVRGKKSRLIPEREAHHYIGNLELWNGRYRGVLPNWGTAEIYRGDSRELCRVIGGAGVVLSSPPYASDTVHGRNGIDLSKTQRPGKNSQAAAMDGYGTTDGNLGHMPQGQPPDAIIGSREIDWCTCED